MNDTILINRLPTRTWNRLGVNETALTWGQADDLGEEKITAAGQTERLEITGSGERGEKMVDIHVPAGQTVTVFETLRAEKGLLVRTALHVEKDAKVRLVQIQNAAQGSLLRLETSGECAENGQVELIQILLGRGDVYSDGHFALNGTGRLYWQALNNTDYELVLAMQMFYTVVSLVGVLLTDLSYGLVDPRVRVNK